MGRPCAFRRTTGLSIAVVVLVTAAATSITGTAGAVREATAQPGRLKVFTTRAIATVLAEIGSDFERSSGRRLDVTTDVAIRMVRRIRAGEPFDVLVASPALIDELVAEGRIRPGSRSDLARSGIGVAVRAGAPKPDVGSLAAFKQTLIAARSIAYLKEGQSGVYIAGVLDRLGLAPAIRSKLTLPETDIVSELVRRGEVELGIVVITQILTTPGVELAGPLPAEIQSYITFTAGISAKSSDPTAANELLTALKSPLALQVMKSQGMDPAGSR